MSIASLIVHAVTGAPEINFNKNGSKQAVVAAVVQHALAQGEAALLAKLSTEEFDALLTAVKIEARRRIDE